MSKEEILRKNNYLDEDGFIDINAIHKSMEEYATQCQEDMANKKYTLKDIKKAFHCGRLYLGREGDTTLEQFINSLNKKSDVICPKCKGVNEYSETKDGDYRCAYTDCQHIFN